MIKVYNADRKTLATFCLTHNVALNKASASDDACHPMYIVLARVSTSSLVDPFQTLS